MLSSKYSPLQEHLQCQCFQFPTPQQKWFLSRNSVTEPRQLINTIHGLPPSVQQTLALGSIKRSLKRQSKPFRSNPEAQCPQTQGNPKSSIHSIQSDNQSSQLKKIQFQQIKNSHSVQVLSKTPSSLLERRKDHNAQVFSRHQPSPSANLVALIPNSSHYSFSQPGKLIFDQPRELKNQGARIIQQHRYIIPENIGYLPAMTKSPSAQQFQPVQAHLAQKQIYSQKKEQRTPGIFPLESKNVKQTFLLQAEKASNWPVPHPRQTKERKLSKVFYSCDLTNEVPKKKSAQDLTKMSLVKHKAPVETTINKCEKRHKERVLFRKMSEVEEIKSLMDEEELEDSEQQSVVLGRLEGYNRTELHFNEIPHLEKENYDESISSTVMTIQHIQTTQNTLLSQSIF